MDQPQNAESPRRDWFATALLCVVVAAMPTQYGHTIRQLNPDGGTIFELNIPVGDVVVALAFALWVLRVLILRRWRDLLWPGVPCFALVIVGVLSGLHSDLIAGEIEYAEGSLKALLGSDLVRTMLKEWVQLVIYVIVAYALFANLLKESRFVRQSLYVLFGVATLAVLLGAKDYVSPVEAKYVRAGVGGDAFLFNSQNLYSGFLAVVFPSLLAAMVGTRNVAVKVWLGACLVVGAVTMLGAGGLLAAFLVVPACAFRLSPKCGWVTTAAAAVLLVALAGTNSRTYRQGLRPLCTMRDAEGDLKKQYVEWQAALDMIGERCALGVGLGLYQKNIGAYYGSLPNKKKMPWDSNNLYLVTAGTTGIVGLAALLFLLVQPLMTANRLAAQGDPETRTLALGLWGSLLAFLIVSALNSLWQRGTASVIIYLIAMVAVLARNAAAEQTTQEEEDG